MTSSNTRFVDHRGHRIAYRVDGPEGGTPIALQHGWTSSKDAWTAYVGAFAAEGYRSISIDSLGHGESDAPPEAAAYGRAPRADDVIAVFDQEGIDRAHFMGYSMGGWIACCMAEFHADRLLSLIIGGHCPGTGTTEEMGQALDQIFTFDDVKKSYEFGFSADLEPAMRHSFDALEDVDGHEEAVASASVPVLLWKGRGEAVICEKGERIARERGWDFFAVDGSHIEAAMNHEPNLPHLLAFLEKADRLRR